MENNDNIGKWSIIYIKIPISYLPLNNYYQIVPHHTTKNRLISINKRGGGETKMISTKNIDIVKTSDNIDELTDYLSELRKENEKNY